MVTVTALQEGIRLLDDPEEE